MIEGVTITELSKIEDHRGTIFPMLRADAKIFKSFGEIYFSLAYPGVIKGWHEHTKQVQNYAVIDGMIKLMDSKVYNPTNIGNPTEITILQLAEKIREKINPELKLIFKALPENDPMQRKPDITKAKNELNWEPKINIEQGLDITIKWFRENIIF